MTDFVPPEFQEKKLNKKRRMQYQFLSDIIRNMKAEKLSQI